MGNVWKNEKQVEFCTLLQTLKEHGRNQTDVAALLGISTAAVSQFVKGHTTPKSTTLGMMRHIVADITGKAPAGIERLEPPLSDATQEKLNDLKSKDPKAYEHLKETIDLLHDRILIQKASEAVKKEGRVSYGKSKRSKSDSPKQVSSSESLDDKIVEMVEDELKRPHTRK